MNSSYQINDHKVKIDFLVDNRIDILQITNSNGEEYIFTVEAFEPPQTNSIGSTPFLQFRGIEISEFLRNNVSSQAADSNFIYNFQNFLEKKNKRNYKFSQSYNWIQFY